MSKQPQLPPRCPLQKKSAPAYDPFSSTPFKNAGLHPQHHKSISQSFILDDHPAWFDDIFHDSNPSLQGKSLRRAASDSDAILNVLNELPRLNTCKTDKSSSSEDTCIKLEPACVYGPNSPRSKEKPTFPEIALVSALSEYATQSPLLYKGGDLNISGFPKVHSLQAAHASAGGEFTDETMQAKRHYGQRSRTRKLQYIAELERAVNEFQMLESELVRRIKALIQEHTYLSIENRELKQQVVRMQNDQLIVDGQYLSLKQEVEKLKLSLAFSPDSRSKSAGGGVSYSPDSRSRSASEMVSSEATWQMLDMGKLHI